MHIGTLELKIFLLVVGFLSGGIISAIIVKYFINKKIKKLYNILNEANLQRIRTKKEQDKKMKVLREITKEFYTSENEIKNNVEHPQLDTFISYISDLNKILNTIGINQIADSPPPPDIA